MKANVFGTVVAGALIGLVSGVAMGEHHEAKGDAKAESFCQNAQCKGNSACKGHGNATCKGHNTCKGQGWIDAKDAKDCAAKKGKWVTAKK